MISDMDERLLLFTLHLAVRGRPPRLKWAREHGCPWDEVNIAATRRSGRVVVLRRPYHRALPRNSKCEHLRGRIKKRYCGKLNVHAGRLAFAPFYLFIYLCSGGAEVLATARFLKKHVPE